MRVGDILFYMAEVWEHVPGFECIDIFSLECFTILLMANTLGDMIKDKRIIFRSDSSNTCTTLNKLFSKNPVMMSLADIWDDMQFDMKFEGLLTWIKGDDNIFSDHASRLPEHEYLEKFRTALDERGLQHVKLQKIQTVWVSGATDLNSAYTKMADQSVIHRQSENEKKAELARQLLQRSSA